MTLQICSLLRGGIAERGGVRVGHRIIEINNQSVVAVPHEKIVNLLATSVGEVKILFPNKGNINTRVIFIPLLSFSYPCVLVLIVFIGLCADKYEDYADLNVPVTDGPRDSIVHLIGDV